MTTRNQELLKLLKQELASRDPVDSNLRGRALRMNNPELSKLFIQSFDEANAQVKSGFPQSDFHHLVIVEFLLKASRSDYSSHEIIRYVQSLDEDDE